MRTEQEIYNAAGRAHEIARLLVNVGNAYGNPASAADIMEWFNKMKYNKHYADTTSIETGLIRLARDMDDMDFFTLYVNVGPSKDKREDY